MDAVNPGGTGVHTFASTDFVAEAEAVGVGGAGVTVAEDTGTTDTLVVGVTGADVAAAAEVAAADVGTVTACGTGTMIGTGAGATCGDTVLVELRAMVGKTFTSPNQNKINNKNTNSIKTTKPFAFRGKDTRLFLISLASQTTTKAMPWQIHLTTPGKAIPIVIPMAITNAVSAQCCQDIALIKSMLISLKFLKELKRE